MKRVFIGCDPGLNGAIAILSEDLKEVEIIDFVTEEKHFINSKVRNQVNIKATINKLSESELLRSSELTNCMLEVVTSRGGQSAQSVFSLGDSFASARACLGYCSDFLEFIKPQEWKGYFGLDGKDMGKDDARLYAIQQIPGAEHYLKRKKDHDRAESLLIAYYYVLLCQEMK